MNKENTAAFRVLDSGKKTEDTDPVEKKILLDKGQINLKDRIVRIEDACPSSPLGTALLKRKREFSWRTGSDFILMSCENCADV